MNELKILTKANPRKNPGKRLKNFQPHTKHPDNKRNGLSVATIFSSHIEKKESPQSGLTEASMNAKD